MKQHLLIPSTCLALLSSAPAGPDAPALMEPLLEPTPSSWLTPSLDIRARYEFREVDGLDPSHAFTTRARLGLLAGEFSGFSAMAELEATAALIDDYRSNPTENDSTDPFVAGNTPIGDPENFELNRAWIQYNNDGFTAKIGRQRIIRGNAAFVGNVGWRQNEQTFDAVNVAYVGEGITLSYAYSDRVQRIFGDEANDALPGPPLRDFEGDFHFLDATTETDLGKLGGYAYLIDVGNNAHVGRSSTFGAFLESGPVHAEVAYQDGSTTLDGMGAYGTFYGHLIYTLEGRDSSCSFGLEYLEDYFKTPFATVHAFNGFADAFVLQRIGLNDAGGAYDGLADIYCTYTRPDLPGGLHLKGSLHYFLDDGFSDEYGWEADLVLVKTLNDNLKGLVKVAHFDAASDSGYADIRQVSAELIYSF